MVGTNRFVMCHLLYPHQRATDNLTRAAGQVSADGMGAAENDSLRTTLNRKSTLSAPWMTTSRGAAVKRKRREV
jgi:hypothetical protein